MRPALLVGILVCAGLFVGVAGAGDNVGLLDFDPQEVDADSGETVIVNATLQSHGGYSGEGIQSVNQTIAYDPEVLRVTDVERGPWLEQGNETNITVATSIDNDVGRVTIEQVRTPADGGATGSGTTAVLTFEVAEDAPPADAHLQYEDVELLLETDFPQNPIDREGRIRIDGGGEERIPLEDDGTDDSPGVTTLEATPTPDGEPDSDSEEPEDQPGVGFVAAVAALLLFTAVAARNQRW